MQQYKVKPSASKPFRKQIQWFVILIYVLIFLILSVNIEFNVYLFMTLILFMLLTLGGLYMLGNWPNSVFDSYTLTISEDAITRHQFNTPTIIILKSEITEIVKGKYGNIVIIGNKKWNFINIPSDIDDYAEIENHLINVHPFTAEVKNMRQNRILFALLAIVVIVPIFMVTFWAKTKIEFIFSGILGIIMFIVQEILNYWSKNRDSTLQKISTITNLMILSVILMGVYSGLKSIH